MFEQHTEVSRAASVADYQAASNLTRGAFSAAFPCCVDDVVCVSASSPARAVPPVVKIVSVTFSGYFTAASSSRDRNAVNNRGCPHCPLRGDTRVKLVRVVDAPVDKRASSWKPAGSRACDVASVSRVVTVDRKKRASITGARSNEIARLLDSNATWRVLFLPRSVPHRRGILVASCRSCRRCPLSIKSHREGAVSSIVTHSDARSSWILLKRD